MKISSTLLAAGFGALAVLAAAPALAQDAAQAPAAQQRPDIKSIGDWSVRCFPVQSPSPCDMYFEADDKNTRQRVVSVSIAYVPSVDRHAIQVVVPLGVAIPKGLVIQTDSFTSPELHYRRCDRAGCYVEMMLPNDSIASLSKSGPEAKIKIVADSGKPFDLRFSLNGFTAAHDSMVQQAKDKAKAPKAAAPAAPAPAP
jgi:invasion protein IalB